MRMSEPHVVRLGLCALAVFVLAILAIIGSDDIWLVVLTFVAIGLVAAVIVIDVWRLMDRSSGEPADEDGREP
jgi:hypothetical protein